MIEVFVARKTYLCLIIEIIVLLVYSSLSSMAYIEEEFTFAEDDMCVQDVNHNLLRGGVFRYF